MTKILDTTRMNAEIRDAMIAKALETSGIAQEQRQLIDDRSAFAWKIRQIELDRLGLTDEALHGIKSKVEELNNRGGSFIGINIYNSSCGNAGYHLSANLSGYAVDLYYNGSKCGEDTHLNDTVKPVCDGGPFNFRSGRLNVADMSYRDEFCSMVARQDALIAKQTELTDTLKAKLKSFRTVGALLENWPDAAELLPESLKEKSRDLALAPETLNAICGIPSGK